jgi:hypothetical protein
VPGCHELCKGRAGALHDVTISGLNKTSNPPVLGGFIVCLYRVFCLQKQSRPNRAAPWYIYIGFFYLQKRYTAFYKRAQCLALEHVIGKQRKIDQLTYGLMTGAEAGQQSLPLILELL